VCSVLGYVYLICSDNDLMVCILSLYSSSSNCWLHSTGMYSPFIFFTVYLITTSFHQRVVVQKDQFDKISHSSSAQLACEAATSIRTIASLTREDHCLRLYSKSLEKPLQRSKTSKTAILSNALFALSSSMVFFVIALVFWYGARLVSGLEISTFRFFVALMVGIFPSVMYARAQPYLSTSLFILSIFGRPSHSVPFKLVTFSPLFPTSLRPKVP
jgi:ABC-type multidrug transport system fused ATPase/permease subunit